MPAIAGIWAAWLVAVAYLGGGIDRWGQWAFYLVTATVLGSVVEGRSVPAVESGTAAVATGTSSTGSGVRRRSRSNPGSLRELMPCS